MPAQNGRPEITDTGARVRGQATNGYCPPGRNLPICGHGSTSHIEDPYEEQDALMAAYEEAD